MTAVTQHPNTGITGRISLLSVKRPAFLNDGRHGQHSCRLFVVDSPGLTKDSILVVLIRARTSVRFKEAIIPARGGVHGLG